MYTVPKATPADTAPKCCDFFLSATQLNKRPTSYASSRLLGWRWQGSSRRNRNRMRLKRRLGTPHRTAALAWMLHGSEACWSVGTDGHRRMLWFVLNLLCYGVCMLCFCRGSVFLGCASSESYLTIQVRSRGTQRAQYPLTK